MIVLPAIDLRDGNCVQLVGGSYDAERVRLRDPVGVARSWADLGFRHLHVVDLDAATGRGSNARLVKSLVKFAPREAAIGKRFDRRVERRHLLSCASN